MPSNTFMNLNDKKKNKIFDAAFHEFSEVSFSEASINRIIKEASIPRGSFYQYFEDKEDLYLYVVHKIFGKKKMKLKILDNSNCDIFKVNRDIFLKELEMIKDDKYRKFFKNFFLNLNFHYSEQFIKLRKKHSEKMKSIFEKQGKKYIEALHLLRMISKDLLIMKMATEMPDEKVIKRYDNQVEIIKHGIYKEVD